METAIGRIVIIGGGTAGWLAACRIASRVKKAASGRPALSITLVESPQVSTIGVGEGSWPTLRRTLASIGIGETDFLLECDASFKQGTRFSGWRNGSAEDVYFHPFTSPGDGDPRQAVAVWRDAASEKRFDLSVTPQPSVCRHHLAPRKRAMPEYSGALNYGYHLDAGRLAAMLCRHATGKLGVHLVRAHITGFERSQNGDIAAVLTKDGEPIAGDLFIDCSGHNALLIGGELEVPFMSRSNTLPNDRALAVQVKVDPDSPIASQTNATAHDAGWIWDIGLPTRRGVGCVYSSAHSSDETAEETLRSYLSQTAPDVQQSDLTPRLLTFHPGHRARFWERNCVAIGQAAGFLEPLEASAIVMIELSLDALLDDFPGRREAMSAHARRFNQLFSYRWERIVEFLKLHYLPSDRLAPYWRAQRDPASIPDRLQDLLLLWRDRAPSRGDFPMLDEVFPAASYQYVLYGMGAPPPPPGPMDILIQGADGLLAQTVHRSRALAASLPTNRDYLDALRAERQKSTALEEIHPQI
ncbi:tryptophan halogenase family protein [Qipengyuania sp.]|uniref:tryptophan halogenase family protein n=1 Tax=Qipengyuania sp. TaxID=2004515 RepID=UPI0035C7F1C9